MERRLNFVAILVLGFVGKLFDQKYNISETIIYSPTCQRAIIT